MIRSAATRVAIGSALLAVGAGGATALVAYAAVKAFHPSWIRAALFVALGLSGFLIGAGYYLLRARMRKGRSDLAPAILGLVGVLVGALTTSGVAYSGDRNRRHDEERVAKRLVATEIRTDMLLLDGAYRYGRLVEPLHFDDWQTQRAVLARYLSDESWDDVNRFYVDAVRRPPVQRILRVE